jgi:class 3 adenylate cyclase
MLKRTWHIVLFSCLLCGIVAVFILFRDQKLLFIIGTALLLCLLFISISWLAIRSKKSNHNRQRWVLLSIPLGLLLLGTSFKSLNLLGANMLLIVGVLSYCFMFAPFELYYKYGKWRIYSNNTWEVLLLSSLDFIGTNFILLGALAGILDWTILEFLIYPGCAILIIGLISWNFRFKKEVIRRKISEDKIKLQYDEIEREKERSDKLLLNILPVEVAEELKSKGSAEAKLFDEVTVLFTDFKDFTKLAEKMTAGELVHEIHTCFMAFDNIMEMYGIEKIKTIGDSYMCAGGLPVANKTHAIDVVNAALDIQQFILKRMTERKAAGKEPFQIRIGIHTGPVVAGIVGVKKFAYDIWGDTVNIASRMESSGEAGEINMSGATYELIKDKFECRHRGKIQAKGKGELDMYFVLFRI